MKNKIKKSPEAVKKIFTQELLDQINTLAPSLIAGMSSKPQIGDSLERPVSKTNGTALHYAVAKGLYSVVELLLEHGADIEAIDNYCLDLINLVNYGEHTPLHKAAEYGHASVVELLLEHGADIEARDTSFFGGTTLYLVAAHGHASVIELLLKYGADIEAIANSQGTVPLLHAVINDNDSAVKLLLEYGADIFSLTKKGFHTAPYSWSFPTKNPNVLYYLKLATMVVELVADPSKEIAFKNIKELDIKSFAKIFKANIIKRGVTDNFDEFLAAAKNNKSLPIDILDTVKLVCSRQEEIFNARIADLWCVMSNNNVSPAPLIKLVENKLSGNNFGDSDAKALEGLVIYYKQFGAVFSEQLMEVCTKKKGSIETLNSQITKEIKAANYKILQDNITKIIKHDQLSYDIVQEILNQVALPQGVKGTIKNACTNYDEMLNEQIADQANNPVEEIEPAGDSSEIA